MDIRDIPNHLAVVRGQTGINPHGPNEAHYIPSILEYLKLLDQLAQKYLYPNYQKILDFHIQS